MKNKNIALCLFGIVGGKGKNNYPPLIDPKFGYGSYKEFLFKENENIDVFIHCWNPEYKDKIINLYNPKLYEFEETKVWDEESKFVDNIKSRWNSNYKVLKLKQKWEEKYKFKYNWVMISRFDLILKRKIEFNVLDNNYFYISEGNCRPKSINVEGKVYERWLDFFFIAKSELIDGFVDNYDKVDELVESKTTSCLGRKCDYHLMTSNYINLFAEGKVKNYLKRPGDFDLVRKVYPKYYEEKK